MLMLILRLFLFFFSDCTSRDTWFEDAHGHRYRSTWGPVQGTNMYNHSKICDQPHIRSLYTNQYNLDMNYNVTDFPKYLFIFLNVIMFYD